MFCGTPCTRDNNTEDHTRGYNNSIMKGTIIQSIIKGAIIQSIILWNMIQCIILGTFIQSIDGGTWCPETIRPETLCPDNLPRRQCAPEARFLSATNPDKKNFLAQIKIFVWQLSIIDNVFSQTKFFVLAGLH